MSNVVGGPYSQFIQLIREFGHNEFDRFELATVTSAAPDLRIQIDGTRIEIPADNIVLAQSLTDYTQTVRDESGTRRTETVENALGVGDRVIVNTSGHDQRYFIVDRAI